MLNGVSRSANAGFSYYQLTPAPEWEVNVIS
jgi:hypothetical protein